MKVKLTIDPEPEDFDSRSKTYIAWEVDNEVIEQLIKTDNSIHLDKITTILREGLENVVWQKMNLKGKS